LRRWHKQQRYKRRRRPKQLLALISDIFFPTVSLHYQRTLHQHSLCSYTSLSPLSLPSNKARSKVKEDGQPTAALAVPTNAISSSSTCPLSPSATTHQHNNRTRYPPVLQRCSAQRDEALQERSRIITSRSTSRVSRCARRPAYVSRPRGLGPERWRGVAGSAVGYREARHKRSERSG
jgi:hypothetical protein